MLGLGMGTSQAHRRDFLITVSAAEDVAFFDSVCCFAT